MRISNIISGLLVLTASASWAAGRSSSELPAVFAAIPKTASAAAVVNIDLSKENPDAQGLVNSLLSGSLNGISFTPSSLKQMVTFLMMGAGAGQKAGAFAQDLDMKIGLALVGDVAMPAPPAPMTPGSAGSVLSSLMSGVFSENGVVMIHDDQVQALRAVLDRLPSSTVGKAWWHGAKYWWMSSQQASLNLMIVKDYLVLGSNPKVFYHVMNAVESGTGLSSSPSAGLFSEMMSPYSLATVIVPPGSKVMSSPGMKSAAGPDSWAGFSLALEPKRIALQMIGPKPLGPTGSRAVQGIDHILNHIPKGQNLSAAVNQLLGEDPASMTFSLYPGPITELGHRIFNALAIVPPANRGEGRSQQSGANSWVKSGEEKIQAFSALGLEKAKEITGPYASRISQLLNKLTTSEPVQKAVSSAKSIVEARVGNSWIWATSRYAVQEAAAQLAQPNSPVLQAGSRILGLLKLDGPALSSIIGSMWSGQGRPFGIEGPLMQLLDSATSTISVSIRTNARYDSLNVSYPVSWDMAAKAFQSLSK